MEVGRSYQLWGSFHLFPYNSSLEREMERLFNTSISISAQSNARHNEVMEEFRHNGKDFEYCPELESGVLPAPHPRRKKNKKPQPTECVFCKNNGEEASFYKAHLLKNSDGKVSCPVLRAYTCPFCGATGDNAHTIKYCIANKNPEAVATINTLKHMKNSTGKRRSK